MKWVVQSPRLFVLLHNLLTAVVATVEAVSTKSGVFFLSRLGDENSDVQDRQTLGRPLQVLGERRIRQERCTKLTPHAAYHRCSARDINQRLDQRRRRWGREKCRRRRTEGRDLGDPGQGSQPSQAASRCEPTI